jgi:carboxyl-terminal processing protease
MRQRRRQPLVAILALLLPVALLLGIYIGGHPASLPGFLDGLVANRSTLVVSEAIQDIEHDYYRPLTPSQLSNASIAGAVASLHDRFSQYLTPSAYHNFEQPSEFSGIGVSVVDQRTGLRIVQVFNSSPAARAGLQAGDVIVAVAGKRVAALASGRAEQLIKGAAGTNVQVSYQRAGVERTVTITREVVFTPVVASAMRSYNGAKVGVVALAAFAQGAGSQVRGAVKSLERQGARAFVLDLRDNGGGLVDEARLVASIFVPKGVIVTTRARTQSAETLTAAGDAISAAIPLVVLVDRQTASASEIVTAALQDHRRAVVVGTHTFGKGVFQEVRPLSNGGALDITVGEYFTPTGRNLGGGGINEGAGVSPNVPLAASVVDTDRGLQAALRTVAGKLR